MQTLMHVDYPPQPPSQNVFDFIFYWGDSRTQKKLETIWVNKVHIAPGHPTSIGIFLSPKNFSSVRIS